MSSSPQLEAHPRSDLLLGALDALNRGVLVVDRTLHVVGATPVAARILGAPIPEGAHVVKILCGHSTRTELAEALAAGRAVVAVIPLASGARAEVRCTPLRDRGHVAGWVVRIAEEPSRPREAPVQFGSMWTCDAEIKRTFELARRLAASRVDVLIRGEAGTGKIALATVMQSLSDRRDAPTRTVSCAVMTPGSLEGQLVACRAGTLILHEIGDLPYDAQAYLLRAIESKVVTPLDGSATIDLDVRVISTSSRALDSHAADGRLRLDLWQRLRPTMLELVPLRVRRSDVQLLADKFVAELSSRGGRQIAEISSAARQVLERYDWPGNVRELRAVLEIAHASGEGSVLAGAELASLGAEHPLVVATAPAGPVVVDEGSRIARALERAGGDRARAAAMLGMSRSTLWRRMRDLRIA